MALRDLVPGMGSADSSSESEPVTVSQMYLADLKPWDTAFEDYRLMLGPDIGGENEWAVYRCTEERTRIPEGTKLYVFRKGDIVDFNGRPFQIHLAQLVQPENVEPDEYDGEFVDFPSELAGKTLPEMKHVSDKDLSEYLLSVAELER
jgi:hypothetical protein